MADMLQAMTALGFIETLVLDLPAALGHAEQRLSPHSGGGEIRQPVGFDHLTVRLVLAIEEDANGFPTQRIPGIEIVRLPNLYAIPSIGKDGGGRPARKAFLGRRA